MDVSLEYLKFYSQRVEQITGITLEKQLVKGRDEKIFWAKSALSFLLCRNLKVVEVARLLKVDHATIIYRRETINEWLNYNHNCKEKDFALKVDRIMKPNFEKSDPEELFYSEICLP